MCVDKMSMFTLWKEDKIKVIHSVFRLFVSCSISQCYPSLKKQTTGQNPTRRLRETVWSGNCCITVLQISWCSFLMVVYLQLKCWGLFLLTRHYFTVLKLDRAQCLLKQLLTTFWWREQKTFFNNPLRNLCFFKPNQYILQNNQANQTMENFLIECVQ